MTNPTVNKKAAQWTNDEILSWAKGELSPTGKASNATVAAEAVNRFTLQANSDYKVVKEQILAEQSAGGDEAPVDPETPAQELSSEKPEDEAPVDPETPAQEEEVVVVAPAAVVESAAPVLLTPPQQITAPVVSTAPKSQTEMKIEILETVLADYARVMGSNVATSQVDGVNAQAALYRVIKLVLNQSGGDFTNMYSRLLDFVAANLGVCFTPRHAYRWFPMLRLNALERKNFERVLNLLIATCERSTRAMSMNQIDLQRTLEGFRDGNIQQRVTEYYSA